MPELNTVSRVLRQSQEAWNLELSLVFPSVPGPDVVGSGGDSECGWCVTLNI